MSSPKGGDSPDAPVDVVTANQPHEAGPERDASPAEGGAADVEAGVEGGASSVEAPASAATDGKGAGSGRAAAGAGSDDDGDIVPSPATSAAADAGEARATGTAKGGEAAAAPRAERGGAATAGGREGRLLKGRYRLGAVVGRGGMGTVWEARDEVLGRTVAVKELRLPAGVEEAEQRRMITRTMREAKAIATIRSRGVVTVFDVVDEGSRPWIVMELIEGRSLADVIRRDGPMSPRRAAEIGLEILDVLRAAHAAGILHRDVKPSNVLISEDDRVVLTDFGIAKVEGDPSITSTGMLVGAPSYISPERARGEAPGPPADLWSLGALLYCCVEGRPPYDEGGAIATLAAVMHDPVVPPSAAGPLTEVVNGLLVKDPALRIDEPTAREMLQEALRSPDGADDRKVVGLATLGRRPAEPPATAAAPAPAVAGGERRRRALIAAAVAVLLAVLGTTLFLSLGGDDGSYADGPVPTDEQPQEQADEPSDEQSDEPSDEPAAQEPTDEPADEPTQEPTGEDAADPAAGEADEEPPGATPEADSEDDALPGIPAGYAEVVDERFQFQISLPRGWERVGIAGQNSGGIYSESAGGLPKIQVDFTASPGEDAEESWRDLEPAVESNSRNYELLSIETVSWRDYPTVADWQFERTEDGERVRVLNRGFRVDDDHGYAIMITCAVDAWDGSECETLRDTAFRTFQPLD